MYGLREPLNGYDLEALGYRYMGGGHCKYCGQEIEWWRAVSDSGGRRGQFMAFTVTERGDGVDASKFLRRRHSKVCAVRR